MERPGTWCRVRAIGVGGSVLATWVVAAARPPDLGLVDLLAKLCLAARRAGAGRVVVEPCPRLAELLELTGLGQMGREPEAREDLGGVQKGVVGGDPTA
jgi:hypothetical protein